MLTALQKRKQTHYFNLVDVDKNGFIEASDWNAIGQNLAAMRGVEVDSPVYEGISTVIGTIWQNLSQYVDTNRDNRASLEEWLQFEDERVINCDEEWYDAYVNTIVRSVVALFDADGDGVISADEYRNIMVSFNIAPRHAIVAFRKLDINGDGHLSKDEMIQHVRDFHRSDNPDTPGNWLFGPY